MSNISSTVDITGVDKRKLLKCLWENSKPAVFFTMSGMPAPKFNEDEAGRQMHQNGYFDYVCGRSIKCDLSKNYVDPTLYDRDNGFGAFKKCVEKVNF